MCSIKLLPALIAAAIVLAPPIAQAEEFTVTQTDKTFKMNGEKVETLTIKVGDSIGETGKVIEITEGRVVIEEKTEKGPETVIIRVEDGKQRVERIRKSKEEAPPLYSPIKGGEGNSSGQGGAFMGR